MRPCIVGMVTYLDIIESRVSLYDIAEMNEALDVRAENENRANKAMADQRKSGA